MKFATAITCIDGRVHQPVVDYLTRVYGVDTVDLITAPGINKLLAEGMSTEHVEFTKANTAISVSAHNSELIAVVGHHDCAGNPSSDQEQQKHISDAVHMVESWGLGVKVTGLWVDSSWEVSEQ